MSNIGYAIFKKHSNFVIDSNGMFEALELDNTVSSIINTIELKEVGQKLLCFKRISSKSIQGNSKDAYLITLVELVKKNNDVFVLGSAICFKQFQVNSNKIIDGVHYLLKQLIHSFSTEYDDDENDLGVLLPSTNKDFKILKSENLKYFPSKKQVRGFDQISISNQDAYSHLDHFCNNGLLSSIEDLYLSSSIALLKELSKKGLENINVKAIINSGSQLKETLSVTEQNNSKIEKERDEAILEKDKIQKGRNLFRILTFVFFLGMITFLGLFITKNEEEIGDTSNSSIYPVNDKVYISHSNYNVNVRSTPVFDSDDSNVKTTLSDGDEVVLLGFDKKTFWAKISYNEGRDIGYVSNRLISKKVNTDRIRHISLPGYIVAGTYFDAPVYASPKEIDKTNPKVLVYLNNGDEIFIKNQDLKRLTYSVRFKKNNKVYNGYLKGAYFNYK